MVIQELFVREKMRVEREDIQTEVFELEKSPPEAKEKSGKNQLISSIITRLFFSLLFSADFLWILYSFTMLFLMSCLTLFTLGKVKRVRDLLSKAFLSVKRSVVCGLGLVVGIFSPSFGIMIACTYFLMYDKSGIEEVIPSSLQEQFKEMFQSI
ncbi:MAG: hypothetical protein L0207_03005 [Chlamydiae bacterium]|nr:hypothetical protein [Chlamydiota bacterium]